MAQVVRVVARETLILSAIFATGVASISIAGFAAETFAESKENSAEPLLGRRVMMQDGRRFHVREKIGSDAKHIRSTVVFETDQGETCLEFEQVIQRLARRCPDSRFITYSRSGLGLSDAPPSVLPFPLSIFYGATPSGSSQRSSPVIARELDELLGIIGVRGPVVLVAHGTGTMHARTLADSHRKSMATAINGQKEGWNVAGMVLIEPLVEGVIEEHAKIHPDVKVILDNR